MVTVACGEKENHVREFLKMKNVLESVWIGLNSKEGQWNWHGSDSSSYSYLNFYNGALPDSGSCVFMKRLDFLM